MYHIQENHSHSDKQAPQLLNSEGLNPKTPKTQSSFAAAGVGGVGDWSFKAHTYIYIYRGRYLTIYDAAPHVHFKVYMCMYVYIHIYIHTYIYIYIYLFL